MDSSPTAHPLGDSAVTISFGAERSPALLARIHATSRVLAAANIAAVEDLVPAYLGITVFYDCLDRSYADLASELLALCDRATDANTGLPPAREHVLRTKYDGIDLPDVAAATGLSVEEVVARHIGRVYRVDIMGFVPGFAYLSELDKALELPRREQPRPRVAAGSVAIAGPQTAVYPLVTPGGWHIIGTTDVVMFDPLRAEPALLRPGDRVRFEPVK
ncbi:MAG: 5-oxoprolinase subunit PxpB [Gemmatimonadaceae bacterium]